MLGVGVDVGGDDIGLDLVTGDGGFAVAVTNGIDQPEQIPRPRHVPRSGKSHDRPACGVGVLPAVLTNARDVTFDVAGVEVRLVERGVEQLDYANVPLDEKGV